MRARFNPADESWGDLLLREVPAGTQTATGKVVGPASSPSTGATASPCCATTGARSCPPVRTSSSGTSSPVRDNTALLIPSLHLTEEQYLDYLAMGFDEGAPDGFAGAGRRGGAAPSRPFRGARERDQRGLAALLRGFGSTPSGSA